MLVFQASHAPNGLAGTIFLLYAGNDAKYAERSLTMKRAKLLRRLDCFQLAEALELPPAKIIGFYYGADHPGKRLPAKIECQLGEGRKNKTRIDAYMWFDEEEVLDFLDEQHPKLIRIWSRNASKARETPPRPLPPGVKMYQELRKLGGIDGSA
jgi:hypothetical protein